MWERTAFKMVRVIFYFPLLLFALVVITEAQNKAMAIGAGMRKTILKEHNNLRSKFAKGQFKDKAGTQMPKARDMLRMVWDKKLAKKSTQAAVKASCKMGPPSGPNVGENQFAVTSNSTITDANKLPIEAVRSWLNEFKEQPWDKNLNTKSELVHAIQAVWGRTRRIGCGAASCDGGKAVMVICKYYPKGNLANKLAYKPGPACSFCPKKKKCNKKRGLCG